MISVRMSEQVMKECARLSGGVFEQYLIAIKEDVINQLIYTTDSDTVKMMQGSVITLTELIERIRDAKSSLRKEPVSMKNAF